MKRGQGGTAGGMGNEGSGGRAGGTDTRSGEEEKTEDPGAVTTNPNGLPQCGNWETGRGTKHPDVGGTGARLVLATPSPRSIHWG